jgi:hypothetical protein
MLKTILLAVALIIVAGGTSFAADGSLQKDPIFQNCKDVSRGNLILRSESGAWVEYWLKDPILDNRWIRYKKNKKVGSVLKGPILDGNWLIWDTDPVGE